MWFKYLKNIKHEWTDILNYEKKKCRVKDRFDEYIQNKDYCMSNNGYR